MSWEATAAVRRHSGQKGSHLLALIFLADHADPSGGMIWVSVKRLAQETRMTERNLRYIVKDLVASGELVAYGTHKRSGNQVYAIQLPGLSPRADLIRALMGKDAEDFAPIAEEDFRVEGVVAENFSLPTEKISPENGNLFTEERKSFPSTPYIDQENDELSTEGSTTPLTPHGGQPRQVAGKKGGKKPAVDPAVLKSLSGKSGGDDDDSDGQDQAAGAVLDNNPEATEKPQERRKGRSETTHTANGGSDAARGLQDSETPDRDAPGSVAECVAWFEADFWGTYPIKVGKKDCLGWVKRRKPSANLREKIITAIKARRILDDGFDAGEIPPTPHPYTWLNGERWEDSIRGRNGTMYGPETFGRILNPPVVQVLPSAPAEVVVNTPASPSDLQKLYDELGIRSEDQAGYHRLLKDHKLYDSFRDTLFYPPEEDQAAVVVFLSQNRCEAIKSRGGESMRRAMNLAITAEYRSKKPAAVYMSVTELRAALAQQE